MTCIISVTYGNVTYESVIQKRGCRTKVKKTYYLDKNLQGEDTSEEIVEIVENL